MTKAPALVKTRMVPIDLIDEPSIIMREEMSDEGLESLARSMRELGQLQAIGVVVEGDRYRVIWGHRRRVAAPRAELRELECKVFPAGTTDVEARKAHENFEQEPLNVVAEATYYEQLFEKVCHQDVEQVAALVHKPLSRVLDRMDLLRWPANVRQALREGQITMAVGKVLNQCKDEGYRDLFLGDAVRQGATARTVQTWVDDVKRTLRNQEAAKEAGIVIEAPAGVASYTSMDACAICGSESDQHEMEYRKIHASCYRVLVRQREQPGPTEPTR
jgi:ParB family chromosome partitioning protein